VSTAELVGDGRVDLYTGDRGIAAAGGGVATSVIAAGEVRTYSEGVRRTRDDGMLACRKTV
jgi:hypothetical protein